MKRSICAEFQVGIVCFPRIGGLIPGIKRCIQLFPKQGLDRQIP